MARLKLWAQAVWLRAKHELLLSPADCLSPWIYRHACFWKEQTPFQPRVMPIKALQPTNNPSRIFFGRVGLLLEQAYSPPDPPDHTHKENCPVKEGYSKAELPPSSSLKEWP